MLVFCIFSTGSKGSWRRNMRGCCHANEGATPYRSSCRHGSRERNKWTGSAAQLKRKWHDWGKLWRRSSRKRESWGQKGHNCDILSASSTSTLFSNQVSSLPYSILIYSVLFCSFLFYIYFIHSILILITYKMEKLILKLKVCMMVLDCGTSNRL